MNLLLIYVLGLFVSGIVFGLRAKAGDEIGVFLACAVWPLFLPVELGLIIAGIFK